MSNSADSDLPEMFPPGHPVSKRLKAASGLLDDAYQLIRYASMAALKFEDDGGSAIEFTLEVAIEKIESAEKEMRALADPYVEAQDA